MGNKIKLTFLGTSAQIPTLKRNHTAIFINYKKENILVDCGEGTQRQFRKARMNPNKINRILITHIHGDHIFGLPGLLSTLNVGERKEDLDIYAPKGSKKFLENFLDLKNVSRTFKIVIKEISGKKIFFEEDDFYLESEEMDHGIKTNAYNFVVKDKLRVDKGKLEKFEISPGKHLTELKEGKDIVYSGKKYSFEDLTYVEKGKKISIVLDTKNNSRIVPFVKGADLFICESSFDSSEIKIAKEHMHMTAGETGKIAKEAKVEKLILTHVSQKYDNKLGIILDDAKKNFKNVVIAKDFDKFEI